jgi:hypothetical protein
VTNDETLARFLEHSSLLSELVLHHAWPVYEQLMRDMRAQLLEELAETSDPASMRAVQGAAQVLGRLLALPAEMIAAAAAYEKEHRKVPEMTLSELRDALGADREN